MTTKKTAKKIAIYSQSALFIAVILGFIVVINYLATKKFVRADLTDKKIYSISKPSKNMLRNLDDIVLVKVCFSRSLPPQYKRIESAVKDILAEYQAYAGRKLKIEWIDPSDNEKEKQKARELGIPELRMNTFEKDKQQALNVFLGIAVIYADKKEVLPAIQDPRRLEYDLTQAIMKVVRIEVPKIAILKTDSLPNIPPEMRQRMNMPNQPDATEEKFKPVFESLKANYTVEMVDVSEGKPIDPSFRTLIVPGGEKFTDRALFEIDQYFMNGGNLIVLVDATKISFQYGVMGSAANPKIMSLMEHYGARVEGNMICDASCGQVQIPQQVGPFQMNVAVNYPYFVRVMQDGFNQDNPAVANLGDVIMPWVSSISLLVPSADSLGKGKKGADKKTTTGVTGTYLCQSSAKSWAVSGYFNLDPNQEWKPAADQLKRSNLIVYLNGSFKSYFAGKGVPPVQDATPVDPGVNAVQLNAEDGARSITAENQGRHLVVAGDADFLSAQNAAPGNVAWLQNVTDWLSLSENLISIRSRTLVDRTIQKDVLKEGSAMPNLIRAINLILMPLVLIFIGLAIYFKRREVVPVSAADKPQEEKK